MIKVRHIGLFHPPLAPQLSARPLFFTDSPESTEHANPTDKLAPDTAPEVQPRLQLEELQLDFGDFGESFELLTPAHESASEPPALADAEPSAAKEAKPAEHLRTTATPFLGESPAATKSSRVTDPLTERTDPEAIDRAFEEATAFAADFEEASLARARIDPNHTERTERWLQKMGLQPEPAGGLSIRAGMNVEEVSKLFRVRNPTVG